MKKKRATQNLICFVYGEGATDGMFLNHLKSIYGDNQRGVIKIKGDGGGSPQSVVAKMSKDEVFHDFPKCFAIIDDDRGAEDMASAQQYIDTHSLNIQIIPSSPCIEYELLVILGESTGVLSRLRNSDSQTIKNFLRRKYGNCFASRETLTKIFPKTMLDTARQTSLWLDTIIREIFE